MLQLFGLHHHRNRLPWPFTFLLFLLLQFCRFGIVSSSESTQTSNKLDPKTDNFILSLWDSLRKSLDPSGIATKKSTGQSISDSNREDQYSRAGSSSRRRFLMEKTLHEHLFKTSHADSGDNTKTTKSIRWKHRVLKKGNYCYFFTQSKESFWSFKWCPQSSVSQGQRNSQMLLDKEITLGSYLDIPSSTKVSAVFQSRLKKLFPAAEVEIYWSGDFCADVNDSRMAAVVIHNETSMFCKDFNLQDYTISQVDEPKTCSYILHACRPRMLHSTDSIKENAPGPQNNETVELIQSILHAYLHRTHRQVFEASNPDFKTSLQEAMPPLPHSRISSNRKLIQEMFEHAYDSYMYNAYPASEIKPMTCKAAVFNLVRIPALTLIDSLDTLIILGNYTEFARSVERLRELNGSMATENGQLGKGGIFALNQNVSVFETTIRILGGLLSAHQLAQVYLRDKVLASDLWDSNGAILIGDDSTLVCERNNGENDANSEEASQRFALSIPKCTTRLIRQPMCQERSNFHWEYDGFLLELARNIGDRLLPAFATHTGIPYGTVNLLTGIPLDETTIASLAGGGTLSLEMELLSRLTGNAEYGNAAKLAARALWVRSSQFNTFGKHICTQSGHWTESLSGIGSNSDSFYEYLVKHYILFPEDHSFWHSALAAYGGVHNESRLGDWYADVDLTRGLSTNGVARRIFEALMAFYPGMQVLLGEILPAARSLNSFFLVREYLGFLPERFDYGNWRVDNGGGSHFLRPELIESAYFLHRATKDKVSSGSISSSSWQWAADYALHALHEITRSDCGFASLRDIAPSTTGAAALGSPAHAALIDDMPSFFLSETLKYLYLTFDDDNILHDNVERDWIFTTEAHPFHHVDISSNQDGLPRLEDRKNELIRRLRSRLTGKDESRESRWTRLAKEKWSTGTPLETFAERLNLLVNDEKEHVEHRTVTTKAALTEPILSLDHVYHGLDVFGETQNGLNDAHLMLRRNGNGVFLKKSCPNFYSSELLYIRALNGGGTDYINSYVSALRDAVNPGESRFLMMGSIDALAWYGSGVHIFEAFDPASFCLIKYGDQQPVSATEHRRVAEKEEVPPQRFDGGDLGKFEILAFDGGAGFSIKHIGSGQSLATTIIQDAVSIHSGDAYFMVDHKIPGSKETDDHGTNADQQNDTEALRSVVMTDTRSNSFVCVVNIVETAYLPKEHRNNQWDVDFHTTADETTETILAQYPCAPALFGASHPDTLARTSDIHIEAQLHIPKVGDEKGCKEPTDQLCEAGELDRCEQVMPMTGSSRIQLVERGSCTFQEKSTNQVGAEAVIVINSNENDLFVMSGNGDQADTQILELPLTVLVSGADGLEMIKKVEDFSADRSYNDSVDVAYELICRISVVRENTKVANDGSEFIVTGNHFWPAVVASPDAVQVFVEDGWGVHAAQSKSNGGTRPVEWQLYLLRHSNGKGNTQVSEVEKTT